MMPRLSRVALLLLSAFAPTLGFAQTAPPGAADEPSNLRFANGIIAVVEDKIITVDDIRRELQPYLTDLRRQARNEQEFNQKLEETKNDIVQNLIDRVLIVKEFYKEKEGKGKRSVPASLIDNQISEIQLTQFEGDRSKFLAYLRSRGKSQREYRREVEEDIVYGYMQGQQRKSRSIVSPVRVQSYYDENKERFYQEDQVHMRLLQLTRAAGEGDEALRDRVQVLVRELEAGASFADLAQKHSTDSKRGKGGDWGWQKRSDLSKEFSDVLFGLQKGQHGILLQPNANAYLLYVEDRKAAGVPPIDDVRDQIERILVQQEARQTTEKWLERLRRTGYVKHF